MAHKVKHAQPGAGLATRHASEPFAHHAAVGGGRAGVGLGDVGGDALMQGAVVVLHRCQSPVRWPNA